MKYYVIVAEGAHDVATVKQLLVKMNIMKKPVTKLSKVNSFWSNFFDLKYPFVGDNILDSNLAPVPMIFEDDNMSVAIFSANGEDRIPEKLKLISDLLTANQLNDIDALMIIHDADDKTVNTKREELKDLCIEVDIELDLINSKISYILSKDPLIQIPIPLKFFTFPNCNDLGTLEDVLLEAAETHYSELKIAAKTYIDGIEKQGLVSFSNNAKRKKAWVGVMTNPMAPGKANQVHVGDKKGQWITEQSIKDSALLANVGNELKSFLEV